MLASMPDSLNSRNPSLWLRLVSLVPPDTAKWLAVAFVVVVPGSFLVVATLYVSRLLAGKFRMFTGRELA